jgi:formamidopyrimidine-DNA glycosylase
MPELPEVETVRRGLEPWLAQETLVTVTARRPDLRFPFPTRFAERLTGRTVTRLDRRAKYLLLHLDDHQVLLSHLGMSGKYRVTPRPDPDLQPPVPAIPPQPHDHIILTTRRASIAYHDPRRFGFMDLIHSEALASHPLLAALGPEPLGNHFHAGHLLTRAQRSRSPLKALLLDQKVVAGLGNIYVAESLFHARLHPDRPAHTLTIEEAERLTAAIRTVLTAALAAGGSSLRDYQGPSGEFGCFQHTFAVYDRAGQPCTVCGTAIQRIVQSGRATCFCAVCQR